MSSVGIIDSACLSTQARDGSSGAGLGGQDRLPFGGPQNFIKRGKNVEHMRANTAHF